MEFNNKRLNPKCKKSTSKEGVICFKLKEARGTGWLSLNDMKLQQIPSNIYSRLSNLHHLYLSRCGVSGTLPIELGYLTKLQILDVSLNNITSIPDNLLVNLSELEVLDVGGNKLRSLPYTVDSLVNLRELCAAENQLVALPHTLGRLSKLQILDVSHNMIKLLQGEMFCGGIETSLQKLFLQHNLLDRIPREIGLMKRLKELDVSFNQLYFLPTTARDMKQLQVLHHQGNKWNNTEPRLFEVLKTDDQLNSSYGRQVPKKVSSLVFPAVF